MIVRPSSGFFKKILAWLVGVGKRLETIHVPRADWSGHQLSALTVIWWNGGKVSMFPGVSILSSTLVLRVGSLSLKTQIIGSQIQYICPNSLLAVFNLVFQEDQGGEKLSSGPD